MVEAMAEIMDYRERFTNFLKSFQDKEGAYKYREALEDMASEGKISLVIDFDDLITFDANLASELKDKPMEILPKANLAVHDAMRVESMQFAARTKAFRARFRKLDEVIPLRMLKSQHMGRLVMVEGIITRSSIIKQLLKVAVYQCPRCGNKMTIEQSGNVQQMPPQCSNPDCGRKGFFKLIPEESTFVDYQMISLQEKPEDLPPGQLPRSVEGILQGDIVDLSRPGDRISLVGMLQAKQEFTSKGFRLATFSTGVEANYLEVSEKGAEEVQITQEDEKAIKELAKDPALYQKIISSVAPSIYGYEEIKEAVAYQLAGGVAKTMPDGIKIRGDVNILLVGDPGTAKSQLLQYIARIAPRGVYTSGKGSTAAGLTATVVRDKNTNEFFLEAGALVLADKGIASIDEIDKMRPEDRSAIHEAMEQQSYHPLFEFTLSDGSKHNIGGFVDRLFDQYPERAARGINCEVLPVKDLDFEILSTDFEKTSKCKIDRVSRHDAPDHFIRITYSNGRSILVTPEHPVYVFKNGQITTVEASSVEEEDFVPAPFSLVYEGPNELATAITTGRKEITLPSHVDQNLASFLGFFISEGYSYSGSTKEVGLSNASPDIICEMKNSITENFGITPIDYTSRNRTLRIASSSLYRYIQDNFKDLFAKSKSKRIPPVVMHSDLPSKKSFIRAAFLGDGSIESSAICYRTASRALAEDYQDLLATIGINSRILIDRSNNSFKVYISGDSLQKFADLIGEPFSGRISNLTEKSNRINRSHDVLPTHVGHVIRGVMRQLGMPYNGYFQMHFNNNYGITRKLVEEYLRSIEERVSTLFELKNICDLKQLRQIANYSQDRLAKLCGFTRATISYAENGGYSELERANILDKAKNKIEANLLEVQKDLYCIKKLSKLRWLRVRKVEKISNVGVYKTSYVYDVTVEPNHNFISNGVVLHNTISIAKAGIVVQLNARSSILAAANPTFGRYVPQKTVAENISELPVTILSRFDLIFTLLDRPDEAKDRSMTEHILNLHRGIASVRESPITPQLLKKYLYYIRKNAVPKLGDEASAAIENFFLGMRAKGEGADSPVPIGMRQLEAAIRLSEARAKLALKKEVSKEDVEAVVKLLKSFLNQVGFDQTTGKLDIDIINVGRSKSASDKLSAIFDLLIGMERESEGGPIKREAFLERAEVEGLGRGFADKALGQWLQDGIIYEPKTGFIKKT